MVQSQSVRLELWRCPVDEDVIKLCEEHTVTNSSSDTSAAQYAYVEAVNVKDFVMPLRLLPGFDFMGVPHLSVAYTIRQGEIAHQSRNFFKAGDGFFNNYFFRPKREEQIDSTNARQATDQSHPTEHTFGVEVTVEVTVTRGLLSGSKFRNANGVAGRPIRLVLHHVDRSRLIALGIVEAEIPVPNEPEEAGIQSDVGARTDHSSLR